VARAREAEPAEAGYAGYQLIRNVLAAYAEGCSFCVVHDERRPDLREAWFQVMAAVRSAEMRTRCKVMTWQELAALAPEGFREFLELKYGIHPVLNAPGDVTVCTHGYPPGCLGQIACFQRTGGRVLPQVLLF